MPPLLLLLLLSAAGAAYAYPSPCSNATCGDVTIAYPFWLNTSSDPSPSCGYPGLGLVCENNVTLIVLLGQTHRYRVSHIAYDTHTISLVDAAALDDAAATCPLLNFNLTIDASSVLQLTLYDSNITVLYNCTKSASSWPPSAGAMELRGCPGYNRSSYVFTGDGGAVAGGAYEYGCEAAVVAPVLDAHKKAMVGSPSPPAIGFGDVLMGGFELNYSPNSDQCGRCERSGGWCGYRQNQTHGRMGFTCFCDEGPTTDQCGAAGRPPYFNPQPEKQNQLGEVAAVN